MIRNFLLVALRNFLRKKFFYTINLLGISIGLSTFIILFFFTGKEEQYDKFHSNKDKIFRIKANRFHNDVLTREMVNVCFAAGPEMKENFPEVERYVQMMKTISIVRHKEDWHKTEKSCYASEDFFKIFSFQLLIGNDSLALNRPHTAVISQSFANKVFKDEDPIGKTINYRGRFFYEITGVFADMPANSHMDFELILSFESYKLIANKFVLEEPWRWDGFVTYLLLKPKASAKALEEKIPTLIEAKTGDWLRNTNQKLIFELQPISSVHLTSDFDGEWKANGDEKLILYLRLIAGSILLLAWINFISLSTAKSLERAREVGVRKTLGGDRGQLIGQFLAEAFLLNLTGLIMALILIMICEFYWPEHIAVFANFKFLSLAQWIWLALIVFGGSFLSGVYPALVLSGFNPALVLKGSFSKTTRGTQVRRILVIAQFVCSLVLVIWIYTASKQLQYLQDQPLGFEQNAKLVIDDSEVYDSLYARGVEVFKKEAIRLVGVEGLSYVESLPGELITPYANSVRRLRADTSDVNSFSYLRVDDHFADVLGLKVTSGSFFSETSTKKEEIVVNESAARLLGFSNFDDAIQEEIYFRDDTVRIIGVLQDFYFHSPKDEIKPLIFQFDPTYGNHYILTVSGSNSTGVIESVQKLFLESFPGQPFRYQFLDEHFQRQYQADQTFERALLFLSSLSIWITCLGLIGMVAYSTSTREKEISIRKVLGSSSMEVLWLFWLDYIKLIILSAFLAIPIAWYLTSHWLTGFNLRVDLSLSIFVLPVILLILITLLVISIQTIKAARANPIEGIRHE